MNIVPNLRFRDGNNDPVFEQPIDKNGGGKYVEVITGEHNGERFGFLPAGNNGLVYGRVGSIGTNFLGQLVAVDPGSETIITLSPVISTPNVPIIQSPHSLRNIPKGLLIVFVVIQQDSGSTFIALETS